ncbi:hypothetical protein QAD02_016903 [Eretmocerus hayati]|uniref:Uncharacterized protein n=1 Tax=Eretmocerus hayati TaxID=131215 RepID=A0ACC2PE74_9HYME|nr:hypothetical protein QAD02_016903 [Eretmocerus hayati]
MTKVGRCIDSELLFLTASTIVLEIISHSRASDVTVVNYVSQYILENTSVPRVDVVLLKPSEKPASLATALALKLSENFSVEKNNHAIPWSAKYTRVEEIPLELITKYVSARGDLAIGVLDIRSNSDVFKELRDQLKRFKRVSLNPFRCKCLLILINHEWNEFENILRLAWSWGFLDLTIVEMIKDSPNEPISLAPRADENETAVVHIFNPFLEKYTKSLLTADTDLFPKKTKDLNGYSLRAYALLYDEEEFKTKNPPELNTGHDYQLLLALAEKLNVTAYLYCQSPRRRNKNDLSIGPSISTMGFVDLSLYDDDRWQVSSDAVWGLEFFRNAPQYLLLPTTTTFNLLVKQPIKISQIQVSKGAVLAYGALLVTGVFFASYARVLGFKVKNWSIINITTAQMGGSLENRGPMSERIYLITMYVTTFIVTTIATDYILELFMYRKEVNNFKTLEELANSNIPIVMDARDFNFLRHKDGDPILEKILNRSERVELSDGYGGFCGLNVMYGKVDDSINLCIVGARDNIPVLKLKGDWYIDRIEEPLKTWIPMLSFMRFTHLEDEMNLHIVRFQETGFLEYWAKQEQRDLISHTIKRGGDPSLLTERLPADETDTEEAAPLKYQLRAVMVIGSSLSLIALVCEVIWSRFLKKTEIGELMRAFNRYSCDSLVLCGREPNKMSRSS